MINRMSKQLFLLFAIATSCIQSLFASPTIIKDTVSQVTTSASAWFGSYGNTYLSCQAFSQDNIVTYKGWQYATYYDANRYVAVARRQLPSGSWASLSLSDYKQTSNDTHNNISMGISSDGRIHLSFDHHVDNLHYRMSVAGLANNPASTSWTSSQFLAMRDNLGSGVVTSFTYPAFMLSANGTLLFTGRIGGSGHGDNPLWRYNNDGTWTTLGNFLVGNTESAYYHGMAFQGNRLHITWCWRVSSSSSSNHDLLYAYSDDFGTTWKNSNGTFSSTTGSKPIQLTDLNYRVWVIPTSSGLINSEGMIVDAQGRVHVISREDVSGVNRQMHYYRDTAGTWHKINTGIATIQWDNRSKIAHDVQGNVYGIMPNLMIAGASVASNYTDWTILSKADSGKYMHSEPLIDQIGLAGNTNKLYVFAQRGSATTGSSTIDAIRYTMNPGETPVLTEQKRNTVTNQPDVIIKNNCLKVNLNGYALRKDNVRVIIVNLQGGVEYSRCFRTDSPVIPIASLAPGTHVVTLQSGRDSWSKKVYLVSDN